MLALAAPALRQTHAQLEGADVELPVLVVLPEPGRADDDERFNTTFVADLAHAARVPIDLAASQVVRRGHAGVGWALQLARRRIEKKGGTVLVGGVDTYYHPEVLAQLDAEFRLHARGAEEGIVPGEAAAFAAVCVSAKTRVLARIVDVQVDEEETVGSEQPNLGRAVTRVVRDAGAAGTRWVLSDLTRERHRLRESLMIGLRADLTRAVESRLPAELGDVGAASGPVALSLAACHWSAGCAPAQRALVVLSSDGPERAAITLEEAV